MLAIRAMKDTLAPGIEATETHTVTAGQLAAHVPVLSTPNMILLIEETCIRLLAQHSDDGEISVGTHVCVSHVGGANEGEEVTIHVRLTEKDRRRCTFDVEVNGPSGVMSEGTHQRAVVDAARFG